MRSEAESEERKFLILVRTHILMVSNLYKEMAFACSRLIYSGP